MTYRIAVLAGVAAVALFAQSGVASAADTYVDQAIGTDTNDCLQPTLGGAGVGPCQSIGAAIGKAGTGDTIHVADPALPTIYAESLILTADKKLDATSPIPTETIIDNTPAIADAILVSGGTGESVVSGFTVRSALSPIELLGTATVAGNRFDQGIPPTAGFGAAVRVNAGSPKVSANTFVDPVPTDGQVGVLVQSPALAPEVTGNIITGFNTGVFAFGGGAGTLIAANTISGTHSGGFAGSGILVRNQTATVSANVLHSPAVSAATETGIEIRYFTAPTGATLHANLVFGYDVGIGLDDTTGTTLESDLAAKNAIGIRATDTADPGAGDLTATNVTAFDSTTVDIRVVDSHATLNSIIVDDPIDAVGTAACSISFSRGPSSGPGCANFATPAAPGFVDPPSNNYHLSPGSAMIDAGDPAAPFSSGDFDGDPRAVLALPGCHPRRDIGADEFVPASPIVPSGCPVPATPAATPPPPIKTCKKGFRLKKVKTKSGKKRKKCVRKKRKRK